MKFRKKKEQNIGHDYVISLSVDRAARKGPSLTTPSNANRVSVRSEEVGGGLPFNATSSFETTGE
jgi:hypothetical protein